MCLLLFKINEDPGSDEYKLVLLNVRDEYYTRPTRICKEWEEFPQIIGAQDLQQGREGGTWMAMNKDNGKLAFLLNILQPSWEYLPNGGRGFLVPDYLLDPHSDHLTHLHNLKNSERSLNGYLLVTMQCDKLPIKSSYYSNMYSQDPVEVSPGETQVFGNNVEPNRLWRKATYAKSRFEKILDKYPSPSNENLLIEELLEMVLDKSTFPVDDQMISQGGGRGMEYLEGLSSIFVEIPQKKYGSRTWSILLIDSNNRVKLVEKTMKEPIYCNETKVVSDFILNEHNFNICSSNGQV